MMTAAFHGHPAAPRPSGLSSSVRANFYLYNTVQDVERLLEAMEWVCEVFDPETAV